MKTIQACVNPRLLKKADRLFTGSVEGRIIELLQNARRAGATKVVIANEDGRVTIRDDGAGIEDFAKLLDLGGSGWDESCEQSEDPAGVGIFCLAPREVTIRSKGKMVTITKDGWTHEPIEVRKDSAPLRKGTILRFQDEPWEQYKVEVNAVFSGLQIIVDGKKSPKLPFVSEGATNYPELGCKIEIRSSDQLDTWHNSCRRESWYSKNVIVNFHGQIVAFDHHPISEPGLHYLVDLTGERTAIRLMLPARVCLVENEALAKLKAAIELEAFRYIQRRGEHTLPYKEFLRAKELGITLPEAKPTFRLGLIGEDISPEPVEVVKPKDFPLARCYRFDASAAGEDTDETNVHLLAALGTFPEPFVPVHIHADYDGYSWANLPTIGQVDLQVGRDLLSECLWSGKLTCVDSLVITTHASDGKVFSSPACMAKMPIVADRDHGWAENFVLVTPAAQQRLYAAEIWYHLGGFCEDGDTYDTQLSAFEQDIERFWANLIGPDEQLRQSIVAPLNRLEAGWKAVHITSDGRVEVEQADGSRKTIAPPSPSPVTK